MSEYWEFKNIFWTKVQHMDDLQRLGLPPGFSQIELTFSRARLSVGQFPVFASSRRFLSQCLDAAEVDHHYSEEEQLIFDGGPWQLEEKITWIKELEIRTHRCFVNN